MKKRIISFLLILCMVLSLLPVTADAYVGDIPGVDYTRIEYNTILDQEVKFKIGSHEFTGKLSNGNRLEEEEVDRIISEFMASYNITSLQLKYLEALEDTGLEYDESRYVQPRVLVELMLAACGGGDTPGESATPNPSAADPGKQTTENTEPQPQEVQDTPFGEYLSEEDILAMLESGDMTYWMSADPEMPSEPVDTGGDEPYSGFSNSIIFTDGGDGEGVEYPDFMSQLSPEMQAQWAEMEQELTDPEMMEMLEGMEGME